MKVLWFTNTPSLAPIRINSHLGGWIASLEFEIRGFQSIELGVAFANDSDYQYSDGKTIYFGVKSNSNSKFKRLCSRYFGSLQDKVQSEKILSVACT